MIPKKILINAVLLSLIACTSSKITGEKDPIQADLAISNVNIINVEDGTIHNGQTLLIKGSKILAIQPTRKAAKYSNETQRIDGTGKFVIPGLWDMHAHTFRETIPNRFRVMLANGITGFRDMWGDLDAANEARVQVNNGILPGPPRFVVSGNIVGGGMLPNALIASTPERGIELVDSLHGSGSPFIKVYFGLTQESYDAIAKRCKELNMPFAGHVPLRLTPAYTSEAGQVSIEHLTGVALACTSEESDIIKKLTEIMTSGNMRAMLPYMMTTVPQAIINDQSEEARNKLFQTFKNNQTWQVPTLRSLRGKAFMNIYQQEGDDRVRYYKPLPRWLANGPFGFPFTDEMYTYAQAVYQIEEALVGEMAKAGVPLLAGTDGGTPWTFPGFALHEELQLFVKAGLTPLHALQTATLNPAKFFDRTHELGTVEVGKLADLVLLNANPLEDISNTEKIELVIADGRLYKREDLDKLLKEVEDMVAEEKQN